MRPTLLLAALALPAAAAGPSLESIQLQGFQGFHASPELIRRSMPKASEPFVQPAPRPAETDELPDESKSARAKLSDMLNRNQRAFKKRLGAKDWDIGVAADAEMKTFFFVFGDSAGLRLAPVGEPKQLIGNGVNVRVDERTVYNVRVQPNIFNPVRGSTMHMTPIQGTQGPTHSGKTGELVDAVRAKALIANLGGKEHWVFYGNDAKADGSGFADTRSFLIVKENGMSSKSWPLPESKLRVDQPYTVDLEGVKAVLMISSSGEFSIAQAR